MIASTAVTLHAREVLMVGLFMLWMPIVASAVLSLVALLVMHMLPGWHKGDQRALPNEDAILDAIRRANVPPGDYRFPYGATTQEMTAPAFVEKMQRGPVGVMTISPNGELPMGRMLGQWFLYALGVAVIVAYLTGRTRGVGAPFAEVFRVSATVAVCCHAVAHWQHWIWWGRTTRFTLTYSIDGVIFGLVTGATFAWLWPR